ncbi:MAG: type I methionyl aminopeptidase [Candidatus Spechtbacteria bacterium RIFCSPLOWO2_02_FULL_38_8]|uniref:Methionine aminopeptidase n=1 Tax=Candidatus Spechtbacteria bacterium RIFCSPLOWO2_02_FULL_38_8 TaxID=1802164 RepID=A0A1G2HH48_9BACT|nr:MAG: type I methionyl aminopeptidase [Candidatus Spechtbacteria bacterium RIFCSPLOWO2_02_FULL_38_8]
MIHIKTPQEIEKMRESGRVAALILDEVKKAVVPGATTLELNDLAEKLIKKYEVKPAFKGYEGFPAVICTSVNEVVVHGVPNNVPLKEGDILSLDFGVIKDGWYSDMGETVLVGNEVSHEARRLVRVTKKALKLGIKKARPGNTTGDIGNTIERYVKSEGFEVVKELVGHGVGRELHEDPSVPNFGNRRSGDELKEGMVIAIEPMVIAVPMSGFGRQAGQAEIKLHKDNFGYASSHKYPTAYFEHTVVITKNGADILTM